MLEFSKLQAKFTINIKYIRYFFKNIPLKKLITNKLKFGKIAEF